MPRTKSGNFDQKEYEKAYHKEYTKYRKANFNTLNDEDQQMMKWIDAQPEGTSGYLKRLVKNDMTARAK